MSIVHTLRVLPEDNAAEQFVQTPVNQWDETDKWFHDSEEVWKTGQIKRKFKQFYDDNRDSGACFLISLDLVDSSKQAAELNVLKNGNIMLSDFMPPPQMHTEDTEDFQTSLVLQERGWDNYKFEFNFDPNDFVTRVEAKYWSDSEKERREHAKSHFSELDGSSGEGTIHLTGLFPKTVYKVVFHLWSDAGKGAASEEKEFTTLHTSKAADFRVTPTTTSESVRLQWSAPEVMGEDAEIEGYNWMVLMDGAEEDSGETTFDEFEAIVENLVPAQTYEFRYYILKLVRHL